DGQYNIGGYFAPSFASQGEMVFVDYADVTLTWGRSIIAHELQHLLHNALDPYENLYIDEGNADVAIYLCFGADSTLTGHVNGWTQNSALSVRWWNQRNADYGAGFMLMMYLVDHLGGGPAMRQLVQDGATGGSGITNLATAPANGQAGLVGTTMDQVFANFSVAATLDSDQGIYGYSNLQLNPACSGGSFCRAQPAATNSDWSTPYTTTGHTMEGWGIRSFKLTPGAASPAPLTLRVTGDRADFDGVVVTQAASDGLLSVSDLTFSNSQATALVPGFGNLTDEVWVIVWLASSVGDCDYTSCGPSYPTGTIELEAARITAPATIDTGNVTTSDRDGDGLDDTVELEFDVLSNAFFEDLDVAVAVRDGTGTVVDTLDTRVEAGGGQPVSTSVFFTPNADGQYSFEFTMRDLLGNVVDETTSAPLTVANMRPVSNGNVSTNVTLSWNDVAFTGDGFDAWGLSLVNNTLPYLDPPVAYAWDFGDNQTSGLKSPVRGYQNIGLYNVSLQVKDVGGLWSEVDVLPIEVIDNTEPIPIITINNQVVGDSISVMVDQRILFSAGRTTDNVPTSYLNYSWDWGDGSADEGPGMFSANHAWTDIDAQNETFTLILTVSDGANIGTKAVDVVVNNRLPVQIEAGPITTVTQTATVMPLVFEDQDGTIESWSWSFPGGVHLGSGAVDRTSDFNSVVATTPQPVVAWERAGTYSVDVTVIDDDGGSSMATLEVIVENQRPTATFSVREASSSETLDLLTTDIQPDVPYVFNARDSTEPDGWVGDQNDLSFNWTFPDGSNSTEVQPRFTFATPGIQSVTLVVTDAEGAQSAPRTVTFDVINPVPLIEVRIVEAWLNGSLVDASTPFDGDVGTVTLKRTFDDVGSVHASPGTLLYFDSDGTRDGDARFEGRLVPMEPASEDWNGLVEYVWDFGDGSALSYAPSPWHAYDEPGNYTITLTVRDAHLTGDVTRAQFTVVIDAPPEVTLIDLPDEFIVGINAIIDAEVAFAPLDKDGSLCRDEDVNDGSMEECDVLLEQRILALWELDLEVDDDEDGIADNDWVPPVREDTYRVAVVYEEAGRRTVRIEACDALNQCAMLDVDIDVAPESTLPPSLSEFSREDWSAWMRSIGADAALFLGLVIAALVLGYLVMRAPTEDEEAATKDAEAYADVERVEVDGMLGIDDHRAPPAPRILRKEERRDEASGYVRPLRRR
ncbi:MAG: PKD domain-containing protein, partial [Candidatus Thermoplasmatota archaeon]|nr:PKD domain-containing protein [Candidatus Thermoplasmatota archaeon]